MGYGLELKKNKKGHPLGVEQTHGWLYRDFPQILCTWSFRECRRHYSSWEVSRESQSSPLRFFVESIATDHQEASSFFFHGKNPSFGGFEPATWSLESCHLTNRLPNRLVSAEVSWTKFIEVLRRQKLNSLVLRMIEQLKRKLQ